MLFDIVHGYNIALIRTPGAYGPQSYSFCRGPLTKWGSFTIEKIVLFLNDLLLTGGINFFLIYGPKLYGQPKLDNIFFKVFRYP